MIGCALRWLGRNAKAILPFSLVLGVALPEVGALMMPLVPALVSLFLVQAMVQVDWTTLFASIRDPRLAILALCWLLVGAPLLVGFVVPHLGLPAGLVLALSLTAGMPPLLSAATMVAMVGLDTVLALVIVVGATLITPFTLPWIATSVVSGELNAPVGVLFLRAITIVGGAVALSLFLRWIAGRKFIEARRQEIGGAGVVLLVVFAIPVMTPFAHAASTEPMTLAGFIVAVFAISLIQHILATALFWKAGRWRAFTVGFMACNRNMALLYAVLPPPVDPAIVLYIAAAQFPIYIMPTALYPVYRRFALPLRPAALG